MRIGFVTPEYVTEGYFSGGLANYLHRASVALSERGHEVHVFTLSDAADQDLVHDGVRVHRVAGGRLARWIVRASGGRLREAGEWIDFGIRAWGRVARVHRESRFDVLQFPNYSACGLPSSLFLRVPFAVRLSTWGPEWNELAGIPATADRAAGERLEALQLRVARHVYAPSRSVQKMALAKARLASVDVIPTPFYLSATPRDPSLFRERFEGKEYLLFFGRYQLHKGFHVLVRALDAIFDAIPGSIAGFVGLDLPSALAPSMREYAERVCARHRERLIFAGQTPHSQLYPVIEGARLVVLPSLVDNLPNACLEAMALGKAVVGTHGTSFEELLTDGVTGFLVPPGDPKALAAGVIGAWSRGDLAAIGRAAQESVQRFAPEITIPILERYFESIVRDG
ncbi:MAG TPA: glycosyltransferase family 4 protein [Thermoanaerobaculia bacterium]